MQHGCRFCTACRGDARSMAEHLLIRHKLCYMLSHRKWACICGAQCKNQYALCRHYRMLTVDGVVDHILQLKLGGGCG